MLKALQELRRIWNEGKWRPEDGNWFPTPGLVVLEEEPDRKAEVNGADVTVCSEFAKEIGGMIRSVRNALLDDLDFYDQEDLYRRMGNAANRAIQNGKECREILEHILTEAEQVYDEWNRYLYFAYDELMGRTSMLAACPTAKIYGNASADGYDIGLDKEGHLTVVPDSFRTVEGVLWLLTQQELYMLETYKNGKDDRFIKRSVIVTTGEDLVSAQTYLSGGRPEKTVQPDGLFRKAVEAARKASLSETYISRLAGLEQG